MEWNGSSPVQTSVGFANYIAVFQDPIFWRAIYNTIVFFVATFLIQTTLGILFAAFSRTLWSIILPSVRGTAIALLMLSIISSLKTFDIPYLITLGALTSPQSSLVPISIARASPWRMSATEPPYQ